MSKDCSLNPRVGKVALEDNLGIRILVEGAKSYTQSDGPVSPTLAPHEFDELWNDVRAQADTTEETTEESTQDPSNPEGGPNGARKRRVRTCEQDPNFTATNLKDIYTVVQEDPQLTEENLQNLDCYLPSKIVDNTRDQAQDCIKRGDTEGACKVLEDALEGLVEQSKEQKHVTLTPWKISVAELLIDQGRRQEARDVLSNVPSHVNGERTSADDDYEKMMEMAQSAEMELDRYRRAEDWDKAREVAHKLHGIHPSYFDLDKPMDRFNQVRRILNAGMREEVESRKASDVGVRTYRLTQALEIYNRGCYASEIYNEFFDVSESTVSGFDHSDCANIFFSAARICHEFDSMGYNVSPKWFSHTRKGPKLTCLDWRHQALHFLEKGRARALLDSINRGSVVAEVRRRLIKKTVILVAEAAQSVLKRRGSTMSSVRSSRNPSVAAGIPVAELPMLSKVDSGPQSYSRDRWDSFIQPELPSSQYSGGQSLTLQTTNLSDSVMSSQPTSPAAATTPILSQQEYSHMRVLMNWRKCLLGALTHPALAASLGTSFPNKSDTFGTFEKMRAKIPSDTLVVEFALASSTPCGIMVIVAATDAVEAVKWKEANTVKIQRCIGDLRTSMKTSDNRTEPVHQTDTPPKPATRPKGPERKDSAASQAQLDALLREFVVAPVKPYLKGKKKLIIVPSGDLAHVPWRIFFDVPITVVPSLEIWLRLQAEVNTIEPQQPKLSVVSTAPEDKEKKMKAEPYIRNIPFSRIEALYIARLHGHSPFLADDKDHSDLEDLTKDTQILHICAHSNFEPESPMSSSLELFKEPLTIRDWHKLSIKADLVVFSSCLSGYSKAYDSGSTIGFAHTLLGTGTKAFIGSLWKVDDRATLLLMTMFYEELRKPLPVVDALYEAQRRMRNLTNDELRDMVDRLEQVALQNGGTRPYVIKARYWLEDLRHSDAKEWQQERYWAAFVLTGYGSNIIYPENDEEPS